VEKESVEAGLARLLALREEWEAWRASLEGAYDRREDTKLDDELVKLFRSYRKALQEAFHLKPGFTYEELILHVHRSHLLSDNVKEVLVEAADRANRLEYVERGSYEEITQLLDLTIQALQRMLEEVPSHKKRRKRGRRSPLIRTLLAMTFILWGPLALLWHAMSSKLKFFLVQRDPRRVVRHFLLEGRRALTRGDLARAVETYEEIRREYAKLSEDVQKAIRPEIIAYYNELLDAYERVTGEAVREEVQEEMREEKTDVADDATHLSQTRAERGDEEDRSNTSPLSQGETIHRSTLVEAADNGSAKRENDSPQRGMLHTMRNVNDVTEEEYSSAEEVLHATKRENDEANRMKNAFEGRTHREMAGGGNSEDDAVEKRASLDDLLG